MRTRSGTEKTGGRWRRKLFRRDPQDKRGRTLACLAALLFCCLLMTACPASGGDLLPVKSDDADVKTTNFKDDTLIVRRRDVTVNAWGDWSASDAATLLMLEVNNAGAEAVVLSFDKCEMLNNESRERLTLRSLSEARGNAPVAFINERSITIEGGQTRKYYASFFIKAEGLASSVSRDVSGQTVTLKLPVSIRNETMPLADFLFSFKYVEYQH